MITIGLIDDHELFRSSLKMFINTIGRYSVVLDEDNGMDFFKKLDGLSTPLDLLITDYQMPVLDGKEVIKMVSQKYPATKIVILSLFKHDHLINETLQAGASGFLTKGIKSSDLKLALEEILLGNTVVYNNSIQVITKSTTAKTLDNKVNNSVVGLSKRQLVSCQFDNVC
ncbi:MAG: response regulator [Bacteroidota bacterium]